MYNRNIYKYIVRTNYMVKVPITLSIDEEVAKSAREKGFNISGEVNSFLRERIGQAVNSEDVKCFFCDRKEEKACRENDFNGMTWLIPDERWLCSKCRDSRVSEVLLGIRA